MNKLQLNVPTRQKYKCPVYIDRDATQELLGIVSKLKDVDRVIILYDTGVENIAKQIEESLTHETALVAVPSGEASKSLAQAERIIQDMLMKGAGYKSLLVNIGGGMLTDLGGFVASIFMRGIRYIQVPTSLMGMADAAIGGRTAIDLGSVKNMIGTVYHPEAVVVDINILMSLPDSHFVDGLVEVIKMAAVCDAEFFGWLEENIEGVLERREKLVDVCIENAVRMKIECTEKAEVTEETGQLLSFGHTVGHAVEALSHFELSHGKAVSIGIVAEMQIAESKDAERVTALLETIGAPTSIPMSMKNHELWEVMQNDKKNVGDDVMIAVPDGIGSGTIRTVTKEEWNSAHVTRT